MCISIHSGYHCVLILFVWLCETDASLSGGCLLLVKPFYTKQLLEMFMAGFC